VKFPSFKCRSESISLIDETDYQIDEAGVKGGNLKSGQQSHQA